MSTFILLLIRLKFKEQRLSWGWLSSQRFVMDNFHLKMWHICVSYMIVPPSKKWAIAGLMVLGQNNEGSFPTCGTDIQADKTIFLTIIWYDVGLLALPSQKVITKSRFAKGRIRIYGWIWWDCIIKEYQSLFWVTYEAF